MRRKIGATGMHLSKEFWLTYRAIEKDGFTIHAKVKIPLSSDTPAGITKSMGAAMIGFADVYPSLKPDVVAVLGNRFEIFAAAAAATVARIPIAHIGGGQVGRRDRRSLPQRDYQLCRLFSPRRRQPGILMQVHSGRS